MAHRETQTGESGPSATHDQQSDRKKDPRAFERGGGEAADQTASTAEQKQSAKPATLRGGTLRALRGLRRSSTLRARLTRIGIMRGHAKSSTERTFRHSRAPLKKKPRPLLRPRQFGRKRHRRRKQFGARITRKCKHSLSFRAF